MCILCTGACVLVFVACVKEQNPLRTATVIGQFAFGITCIIFFHSMLRIEQHNISTAWKSCRSQCASFLQGEGCHLTYRTVALTAIYVPLSGKLITASPVLIHAEPGFITKEKDSSQKIPCHAVCFSL